MKTYFKGCFSLKGKIDIYKPSEAEFEYAVSLKDKSDVTVKIIPKTASGESFYESMLTKELWDLLSNNKITELSKLPPELRKEIADIVSDIDRGTQKALYFIKYWLRYDLLEEGLYSMNDIYWSLDKSKWVSLPYEIDVTIHFDYILILNKHHSDNIQQYIKNDIEPFMAFRHLFRAKKETISRYKWIEATIAAELAIKEFFVRFKPELEPLLLDVPSPPLYKLYGKVLNYYAGEKSPKLTEIQKGVEIRNKLLHRPLEQEISHKKAIEYIHDIEIAIYHLLKLLYPKDHFIKELWDNTVK